MGPSDRAGLIILCGHPMHPELYEIRPECTIIVDAACTATPRDLPLEEVLEVRDHLLEYMAIPDVSERPYGLEKPPRRSGQKSRPVWPGLDKRGGRR